jgi:D-aminoacyl-tRNA deacylase
MRIVLQRVTAAAVSVDGRRIARIDKGLILLVGIAKGDTASHAESLARKISVLRVFEDDEKKMNLDIKQAGGEVLSVSQFTLLGSVEKGNRPGFERAAPPDIAKKLWQHFNACLRDRGLAVTEGIFAARMSVSIENDGPVTLVLDSPHEA